jgi:DNA-binding LacI/PurR family transcriptional regulator
LHDAFGYADKHEAFVKATIKHVAELAHVHPSTVSRVFSGSAKISEVTRRRVMDAAGQLNFHPNAIARSLTTQRAHTLGMIIPYTQEEFFLDSFFPQVLRGLANTAYRQGFRLILAGVDDPAHEPEAALQLVRSQQVDGMIVQASRVGVDTTDVLLAEHLPFVLLGRPVHDTPAISWIEVDAHQSTREAVRYLIGLGHQRVAFIGGRPNMVVTIDRLQGYRQALDEAGLAFDERLIGYGEFRQDGGAGAMHQLLTLGEERPTAVFAANDLMAIGAIQALREANLEIPRDCSVVGSNDSPIATLTNPRLTSSRAPYYDLACEAAQALIAHIECEPTAPVKKLLPCELIMRDSTAPPPHGI